MEILTGAERIKYFKDLEKRTLRNIMQSKKLIRRVQIANNIKE